MRLYLAKVDCWRQKGHDGRGRRRFQRQLLIECERLEDVNREAVKAAEAMAPFGQPWIGFEFREAYSVKLPMALVKMRLAKRSPKSFHPKSGRTE